MGAKELNRVVFYSKQDMACFYELQKAEELLIDISIDKIFDINELLELYHIKRYFENDLYLPSWDEKRKKDFEEKVNRLWDLIRNFWLKIDDTNILPYIENIEFSYQESFWELIQYFQVYKNISKEMFFYILNEYDHYISDVLLLKKLVDYFDNEMANILIKYKKTAELLLSNIEERRIPNPPSFFFPNSLSLKDKEDIILRYIESEDANLNYIRLVEMSKDSKDLKLSPQTRLKAQKKALEINTKIQNEGHSLSIGVQVALSEEQTEPYKLSNKENILIATYSKPYFDQLSSNIDLFHIFSSIFNFIDNSGLITLVSKDHELNILEKIGLISKNEYSTGVIFNRKAMLSHSQMKLFNFYLNERNTSIEKLIESFIDLLNKFFNESFKLKLVTESSTYLEKIRIIAPELEFFLKQYKSYVNNKKIDFDLLEFDSTPVRFSEILSLVDCKYVYRNNDVIDKLEYYFFSDQCLLYYVDPYKDKYNNLYSLLMNEDVQFEAFKANKQNIISKLIEDNYLYVNEDSCVKIKNTVLIYLIRELHHNGVISYWHYDDTIRLVIDKMICNHLVYCENTLFTKQEINYFNYYLNKKEFTNGFDLRNKYLHGSNSKLEEVHERDYYFLLQMIVLVILKISDDVSVKVLSNIKK